MTLALQLRRELPGLTVSVIEKSQRPLPPACHKVGESSVEVGARYYTETLGLSDYFRESQLPKLGLRFFFGDSSGPIEDRPEFGASRFAPVPSYQIDRGVFENDLRGFAESAGVALLEGYGVSDVELGSGTGVHKVIYRKSLKHPARAVTCRWAVDASGRRRLLLSKLGLKRENGHDVSAVWFRMKGRLDVCDLVPRARRDWHEKVPDNKRFYSTNHLMGRGYWVWLIPLSSGHTSVGIVADEEVHPFAGYATFPAAREWLKTHEPVLDRYLEGREPADFKRMKLFSYGAKRVFSPRRWACVGEAGLFTDPFYSPGSDFIAVGNTMVTRMIELDRRKEPLAVVSNFERLYFLLYKIVIEYYRKSYPIFGTAHVMTAKNVWDWSVYWSFMAPLFFHGLLVPEHLRRAIELGGKIKALNDKTQELFRRWAARAPDRRPFAFLELFQFPILRELHLDLRAEKSAERAFADMELALVRLRELSGALFAQAGREVPGLAGADKSRRKTTGIKEQLELIFS